jgi:hypothetical protein
VADAMTLDELESHDDPRVRALVRELRAARDVVAAWRSEFPPEVRVTLEEKHRLLAAYDRTTPPVLAVVCDAAKEPA